MITFRIDRRQELKLGTVFYKRDEYSFRTTASSYDDSFAIAINELNLMFNFDNQAEFIRGLCPHTSWNSGLVHVPGFSNGGIVVNGEFVSGIAYPVHPRDTNWPITFDSDSGWVDVCRSTNSCDEAVSFLEGVVVGLTSGELTHLWIRPAFV